MQITSEDIEKINLENFDLDAFWSNSVETEDKMHKIHGYPAKFPAFLVSKSIEYAKQKKIKVDRIGDVFCGCGTTALETRKLDKEFYGWDINPVATLIARVKSESYQIGRLEKYFSKIISCITSEDVKPDTYFTSHERINYWFSSFQIKKLYTILHSIRSEVPEGKYQDFFLCAFSNILKACSMWLTKSIKPQYDPDKSPIDANIAFERQINTMLKAVKKGENVHRKRKAIIKTQNFLEVSEGIVELDLIVTSPPYVTSYEYADLHQLSTLWLGFIEDYRDLREGTIGSMYHVQKSKIEEINEIGKGIVEELENKARGKSRSVNKYFIDMKRAVEKTYSLTGNGGMNIFVIGNTSYSGVKVDNAKYLLKVMAEVGFRGLEVFKRKIGSKILTPYRDEKGRFSNDSSKRKVYNYEFVITGQK